MSGRYLFGRLPVQWRWGEVMFAALVGGGLRALAKECSTLSAALAEARERVAESESDLKNTRHNLGCVQRLVGERDELKARVAELETFNANQAGIIDDLTEKLEDNESLMVYDDSFWRDHFAAIAMCQPDTRLASLFSNRWAAWICYRKADAMLMLRESRQ